MKEHFKDLPMPKTIYVVQLMDKKTKELVDLYTLHYDDYYVHKKTKRKYIYGKFILLKSEEERNKYPLIEDSDEFEFVTLPRCVGDNFYLKEIFASTLLSLFKK